MNGNSGCKLELIKGVVRKTSPSTEYNPRLLKQVEKQDAFKHPEIFTPKIYDMGKTCGLVYFDMEYISGQSLYQFCKTNTFKSIERLLHPFTTSKYSNKSCKKEIRNKCESLAGFPMEILDYFDLTLPTGSCHGDATFENILIKNDTMYLIDFLDSYVESPSIDQSKIMQDSFCGWSYRHSRNKPLHNLVMINEMFESRINYLLLLINLYRIIPYSLNNTEQNSWIQKNIKKVMTEIS